MRSSTIGTATGSALSPITAQIPAPGPVGEFTRALSRGFVSGRSVLEGRTVHVGDMHAELDDFPETAARRIGSRTVLGVPLLRAGAAIGTITLRRMEVRLFTDRQVALLQTFADQAVIAIENMRLFNELEARNRQLTEALEQQTATSEILRVISGSPTDVQPVFDAIVANAAQLCGAEFSAVMRFEGGLLHLVAVNNMSQAETAAYHTV
jgi:two-component system, NtrC family, sensor kinase